MTTEASPTGIFKLAASAKTFLYLIYLTQYPSACSRPSRQLQITPSPSPTSTAFNNLALYNSNHSIVISQTMSSDSDFASEPFTPPKSHEHPCMFTIEQSQSLEGEFPNVYMVRPAVIWDSLKPFRKFISTYQLALQSSPITKTLLVEKDNEEESYSVQLNDIVTVTRHDLPSSPLWTAHILEIRGHQTTGQAFIRLYYFYQPSQLPPSLRQNCHGRHELIASNCMAVIDATAVVSRTPVSHWHEEHDLPPAAGLFWRQKYNILAQDLSVRAEFPLSLSPPFPLPLSSSHLSSTPPSFPFPLSPKNPRLTPFPRSPSPLPAPRAPTPRTQTTH